MPAHDHPVLAFYARPAALTSAGRFAPLLESLPRDIPGLAGVLQGLLIHEHLAHGYGVTLAKADRASVQIRPAGALLAQITARDSRPLYIARAPAARLPGNCRHFRCRAGTADPGRFGLSLLGEAGDWWIAGNLMRDAAALRNVELLPWDCWGAMPDRGETISGDLAALFGRLAALTQEPGASFAELAQLMRDDDRLRVPPAVRNALRHQDEPL